VAASIRLRAGKNVPRNLTENVLNPTKTKRRGRGKPSVHNRLIPLGPFPCLEGVVPWSM
jgi:hypothetical protein